MPRTLFRVGTAASAVGLLIAAAVPALADTVTLADGLSATNPIVITDCTSGATRVATTSSGNVKLTSDGNGDKHFAPGQGLQVTHTSSATSLVLSAGTLTTPTPWNKDSTPLTAGLTVTVPAGTVSGTYDVAVTVTGDNDQPKRSRFSLSSGYTVKVQCPTDTTPPALSLPANLTVEASAASTPVVWTASATDDVSGDSELSCMPASGSGFPVGTTSVSCSATDAAGNRALSSFTVTVTDTQGPAVTVPEPIFAEAVSAAGAVVNFSASATDLVSGAATTTCLPSSGSTFALGITTVTCSASDARGIPSARSFSVTVGDTTEPVVSVPSDISTEATGPDGAEVSFEVSATDQVTPALTPTCKPPSESVFALGMTTVTCSATDGERNTGSSAFAVTVRDTLGPVISGTPATKTLEATSKDGAPLTAFAPTALDLVDLDRPVTCLTGDDILVDATFVYPLDADTKVTCSATDTRDNVGTATYVITVKDRTGPALTLPADMADEATSAEGAAVTFEVSAYDLVDEDVPVTCTTGVASALTTVQSGDVFPLGTTTVTCSAEDARGNASDIRSFTVTVVDTTPPKIADHGNETAEATSQAGALVSYLAPATTDLVDPEGTATCSPVSGSQFPLGTTPVTCNAEDAAGNPATPTTFTVLVQDTTAPVIARHDGVPAEATSDAGAVVTYTSPATSDAVDGAKTASCLPASGSQFALGATAVKCNATDAAGNGAVEKTFDIVVSDTTAPVIAARGALLLTATSAAGAVGTYTAPATSDLVDGAGTATCLPASGSTFPVGTSTVSCSATDAAGNTSTTSFPVTVGFGWHGFFQPIDTVGGNGKDSVVRAGTVFNKAKAGSAIPVKFDLSGNMGLNVLAVGYPKTLQVACPSAALFDTIEETSAATTSGLKYDAVSGQYNYTWKTASNLASTCQRLEVKLVDGASYYAFFQLTK